MNIDGLYYGIWLALNVHDCIDTEESCVLLNRDTLFYAENIYNYLIEKTIEMEAIIVSIFVSVVACVGGIYFYLRDKREEKKNNLLQICIYHIYYIYLQRIKSKGYGNSSITEQEKSHRPKGDTFRSLSLMAANKGTNLKRLIEGLLDNVAEDYDDSKAYAWLVENRPDGQVFLNENEKKDFENWLGV